MKKVTFNFICFFLFFLSSIHMRAQVSGLGFTLSPTVEYVLWDDQSALDDNILLGGKLGISFGQFVELRGVYMQSTDLKTDFSDFDDLDNFDEDLFVSRSVDLTRWGGEIKANLGKGALLPYLTLGSGVQTLELNDVGQEFEQIYLCGGVGIVLSVADRFTLNIEAKNTQFNINPARDLLTLEDQDVFGVDIEDTEDNRVGNWSLSAALQFYLGGRRPNEMSELDKAYFNAFSSGLKGPRIPIEPALARIEWDDASNFRDTWLGGGYAGIDFGPYVGLRGFYFRSMENDEINFDFESLEMFGGEARFNLSDGQGITPYISIGGGYINVDSEYVGENGEQVDDEPFAMGGLGLNLPLSDRFKLFGGAKALLTSQADVEELNDPDAVRTNLMYNFGINLVLGASNDDPDEIVASRIDQELKMQEAEFEKEMEKRAAENRVKTAEIRQKYETRIADLEEELNKAYEEEDVEKAADLLREKEVAEEIVEEIDQREYDLEMKEVQKEERELSRALGTEIELDRTVRIESENNRTIRQNSDPAAVQMSALEFQSIIEKVLQNQNTANNNAPRYNESAEQSDIRNRLERIERNMDNNISAQTNERNKMIEQQLADMRQMMKDLNNEIQNVQSSGNENQNNSSNENANLERQLKDLNKQISDLEQSLNDKNSQSTTITPPNNNQSNATNPNQTAVMAQMLNQLEKLNDQIRRQQDEIEDLRRDRRRKDRKIEKEAEVDEENPDQPTYGSVTENNLLNIETGGDFIQQDSGFFSKLRYEGMSGIAGVSVGNETSFNVGFRWHYGVADGRVEFMPEAFFGFADPASFGLSGNVVLPFTITNSPITPYAGVGVGFMQAEEAKIKLAGNIIVGSYLKVANGRLYVDYTNRNLFNYNQFSVGYRFSF